MWWLARELGLIQGKARHWPLIGTALYAKSTSREGPTLRGLNGVTINTRHLQQGAKADTYQDDTYQDNINTMGRERRQAGRGSNKIAFGIEMQTEL